MIVVMKRNILIEEEEKNQYFSFWGSTNILPVVYKTERTLAPVVVPLERS
jgi:hypothetical protein